MDNVGENKMSDMAKKPIEIPWYLKWTDNRVLEIVVVVILCIAGGTFICGLEEAEDLSIRLGLGIW